MLNEDVVKNINKLDKEQDNINLELSKKASKEDLEKVIQNGTNVAVSKDISTSDWMLEENTYTTIIEHNLVTRKVLISLMEKTTNNNIFCSYQILDDNRIKIFNESNNELECIVVNGNSAINMVSATIDDNRSTETTTYSSTKIESLLKALKNKINDVENLKETENIKCTTDTAEYIIENSKKGYLTNFNIEGKTLVNLASTNMFTLEGNSTKEGAFIKLNNSATYVKLLNRLNTGIYTLIVNVTDINVSYTIHTILSGGGNKEVFTKSGNQVLKLNMDNNIDKLRVYITDSSDALNIQMLLLEGDYTNKYVPYFEGLQSVGQGDNIELLSYQGENLFDGTYQDGYFNGNSLEEEFIQGMPCITTNWIDCNPNVEYYFLGGNRKQIQFKNENNIFKSVILNSNNFETPTDCTHFRVYYARTDQFYFPLNIYKKGNIKIIPYTLRSLSDEIKDRIVYKNNSYKLVQKCKETILDGQETWGIHTSIEKDNTIVFTTNLGVINSNENTCILKSDKFKEVSALQLSNSDYECIASGANNNYQTMVRISKTKANSLETFKAWLESNNITFVYPLERPQEIELVDLSMQTFEDKTKFLLSTGSIIPKVSFDLTQNFGNNIEILKRKINTLENIYTYSKTIDLSDKLLNGWEKAYDIHQGLILSKIGNVVQISSVIKDGLFTAGTIIVYLPKEFTPSKIAPIQIFDNGESLGSLEIRPEGYIKIAIVKKNSTRIIFNGSYILD
ncbi:hypothetical protein [Clostridioides sp. ES-S-0190-01]|uniref:hypothetical protein n=1 Tax=Clostridioides sp. ES-S-0190-01 TaxID=2770787 RepID=UPI001D101E02|nr:hypothetical protein [Clostridioides sp. ES-S-0190-01]